MLAKIV
jgi:hypothetical protein